MYMRIGDTINERGLISKLVEISTDGQFGLFEQLNGNHLGQNIVIRLNRVKKVDQSRSLLVQLSMVREKATKGGL